jgi:hypothetical protein
MGSFIPFTTWNNTVILEEGITGQIRYAARCAMPTNRESRIQMFTAPARESILSRNDFDATDGKISNPPLFTLNLMIILDMPEARLLSFRSSRMPLQPATFAWLNSVLDSGLAFATNLFNPKPMYYCAPPR